MSSATVMTFCSVALCCAALPCGVVIVRRIPPPVVYLVAEIGLFEEDARELVTGTYGMLGVCDVRVVRGRVNMTKLNLLFIDSSETLFYLDKKNRSLKKGEKCSEWIEKKTISSTEYLKNTVQ